MKQFTVIKYKYQSTIGNKIIDQQISLDNAIDQLCDYLIGQDLINHPHYDEFWSQKIQQLYSLNLLPKQSKRGTIQLAKENLVRFSNKYRDHLIKMYHHFELKPCKPIKSVNSGMRYKCYLDRELNQYHIRDEPVHPHYSREKQEKSPPLPPVIEKRLLETGTDPLAPTICRCECCQAVTKKGHLCRNRALYDGFCWMHRQKYS
jgi:hypothetical protein